MHDELDFTDAAGSKFDVVLHVAPLDFAPHLLMQIAQRFESAVIEVAPEDKMRGQLCEFRGAVATQHAPLDPCIAFPFAALGDEIVFEHRKTAGQRTVGAEWAQAHINAKDITIGGDFIDDGDQAAAQTREELMVAQWPRALRFAVLGVGEYQIDVGGDVEFVAAKLAHADDVQVLDLSAVGADRHAVIRCQLRFKMADREFDGDFRQRRDGGHHFFEVGKTAQIAGDQAQHDVFAQHPQRAH